MCGERWAESLSRVAHGLRRLVVIGDDGLISLAALRWLADQSAAFIMLDRQGRVLNVCGPVYPSDARLRRSQALAMHSGAALEIAQHLIAEKLSGQARIAREKLRDSGAAEIIESQLPGVADARSMDDVLLCEMLGAKAYWSAWRSVPIGFAKRDADRVPHHWLTFSARRSPLSVSPRLAADPVNAMLNFSYALLEAEARLAANACGLDPGLGFFHADSTRPRDSLACDLQEPIRPMIDEWLLDRIMAGPLRRSDFFEERNGNCRLMSGLCAELARSMPVWAKRVAPFAEHVAHTLWKFANRTNPANVPATPLTQTRRRMAKGHPRIVRTMPVPALGNSVCRKCGRPVGSAQSYCFECISATRESDETKAQRSASIKRHRAALRGWDQTQKPAWLTEEVLRTQVIPKLGAVSLAKIAGTLGISNGYAVEIRSGARWPHPRHWEVLAGLAGVIGGV